LVFAGAERREKKKKKKKKKKTVRLSEKTRATSNSVVLGGSNIKISKE
jgi:hypothetical protein